MQIIQIVTRLPPAIDGVGDYAYFLARQLRSAHDIHTVFVVCDPGCTLTEDGKGKSGLELDGFPIRRLKDRRAEELLHVLSQPEMPTTILLQFVGYGYATRGCPLWLTRGLEAWKMGKPKLGSQDRCLKLEFHIPNSGFKTERRLLTMFHEIYASGPPWRTSFWTSPVQKWIAKRLLTISNRCRTNTWVYSDMLRRLSPQYPHQIPVFPVFSNVGEPEKVPPLRHRKRQILIFGSAVWRRKVYTEQAEALQRACRILRIEKVVDVGEPVEIQKNIALSVERTGPLLAAEVSRRLSESMVGFLTYFEDTMGKSGIFAAYCAHGVLPVMGGRGASELDGIKRKREYLSAWDLRESTTESAIQVVADNAHAWYRKHSLENNAANTATLISEHRCACI